MTSLRPSIVAFGLATVLAGCAGTAPLSVLDDGRVYYRAVLNRFPVIVTRIDDESNVFRKPVLPPGEHRVRFSAAPVAGFTQPVEKTYLMNIAPCTRYYVAAQRSSKIEQDWDLVVERTDEVGGCDPTKEWQKAGANPVAKNIPYGIVEPAVVAAEPSTKPGTAR